MEILSQAVKGQVFIKFLWQHKDYQNGGGGVSPRLISDLSRYAERENITTSKLFLWINHNSVIPRWARLASFRLALEKGWQPIDLLDVLSVIYVDPELIERKGKTATVNEYKRLYGVKFPAPLIKLAIEYELR